MLLTMIAVMVILMGLSVPVAVAIGLAGVVGTIGFSNLPLIVVPQQAFIALDKFPLAAIPFFIVAGNITNVRYSFRHWFAFCWWVATPQILSAIPALLILLLTDTSQLDASALNPLSLNELVFHRGLAEPGYSFLTSIGLIQIAIWWLTVVGVKVWSGRSTLFCTVFALLPSVIIYGLWALVAFR